MQEAFALETEQSLRRENSHLQTLVDAGTSLASRDDSAMGALQKSFSELMQEREQQVHLTMFNGHWPWHVRQRVAQSADTVISSSSITSGLLHIIV